MDDQRPNPEILLDRLKAEERDRERGHLKIFFGFAPGVGKTYAMLQAAREKKKAGVDVLVGLVETHKRPETDRLLKDLEILPRKTTSYRNVELDEFDIDAALARKPALILVDELAHTNSPDSRHPKRWNDVEELLQAGVDVYSTLNVQHLESLNDVVGQITGVTVHETVPDSILDNVDELELVDIPPEELLERLEGGKVYVPDQAKRAIERFFRKGNLIALRELSLRQVAERVARQMQVYRQERAIRQTWPAVERLLIGVSPSPFCVRLIRAARRMAESMQAEWFAVYVETPSTSTLPQQAQDRVSENLRLATGLGAQTMKISGINAHEEMLNFAKEHNITKILVGKPIRRRPRELFLGTVVDKLIRDSRDIDVYVLSGEGEEGKPQIRRRQFTSRKKEYAIAFAVVALCTLLNWFMNPFIALTNLVMIYLGAVVFIATFLGRGPAISASVLSVLTFDYLYVPPYYTLAVSDTQYGITLIVMLLISIIISSLTVRLRQTAENARKQERQTAVLYELSRKLAATQNFQEMLATATEHLTSIFDSRVAIFLPNESNNLQIQSGDIAAETEHRKLGVATWVYEHGTIAGMGTDALPGARGIYLPLRTSRKTLGVMRLEPSHPWKVADPDHMRILEAFANQIALGIERENLTRQTQNSKMEIEAERMRNTLLSSVSHDLRIPLTVIEGSASALIEGDKTLTKQSKQELAQTIYEESHRLDRQVNNLLEMSRLQSGEVKINKEWHVLEEVVGTALSQLEIQLQTHPVTINIPSDLPMVNMDALLIERVLVNLIENAAKHTPSGTPIEISAQIQKNELVVEVSDRGPGLPADTEELVFEKFFRTSPGNTRGIGLGLSICRAILQAHGGQIKAANRAGGGATFYFTLPMETFPFPELGEITAHEPSGTSH